MEKSDAISVTPEIFHFDAETKEVNEEIAGCVRFTTDPVTGNQRREAGNESRQSQWKKNRGGGLQESEVTSLFYPAQADLCM